MQTKDKSITVFQASSWPTCDDQVRFAVTATSESVFQGNKVQLQKIIGGLRAVTSGACARMVAIEIIGYFGDEPVYSGVVRKSEGWRLIPVKRTARDIADAASDNQRFLDILASSNNVAQTAPAVGGPLTPTALGPLPVETLRDQYAYQKLTQNLDQILGLPGNVISDRCRRIRIDDMGSTSANAVDLLYRVCRAAAYADGNLDSALDLSVRILKEP